MGKNSELISNAAKAREEFESYSKLLDKCLSVFETKAGISMPYIEKTVQNEWEELYKKYGYLLTGNTSIEYQFLKLKDGIINRKEFKESMTSVINCLNEELETLENEAVEAENALEAEFDSFLTGTKSKSNKYLAFFFQQPEVKKKLMDFFKS